MSTLVLLDENGLLDDLQLFCDSADNLSSPLVKTDDRFLEEDFVEAKFAAPFVIEYLMPK